MHKIIVFIKRLERIGINVKIVSNFPWIYLTEVNGKRVEEKYLGNHGFTIAFYGTPVEFTDITYIFQIIRKYK